MNRNSYFFQFLRKAGHDVVSFTESVLAFEYYSETADRRSLIVTDLKVPGICGIDLAKKIRQINSEVKIFLMTAFDAEDLKNNEDFKKAKIDRLIQKPIRLTDLRQMINDVVSATTGSRGGLTTTFKFLVPQKVN